ncbi:aminoacyl-tRNA hydrolase [Crocinitomicaceae bacterium]|nr:aminoacyl-tRNA hydrolase [Crocinitomicaceae bacterium]
MKYLIVGLGNPGSKYADTRHNIGFDVLDALIKDSESSFETARYADRAEIKFKGRKLVLIKPNTFMNLSGKAVHFWLQKEKIPMSNLLVISDDLALPFGTLRLKGKGSAGGHNGLKDIEAVLKTGIYSRLRFGIGSDYARGKQADFVLGPWSLEEQNDLSERIIQSTKFVLSFVTMGLNMTMSALNGK